MKPAPFDYYAPTSIEEALDKLTELGYSGKVLAGGQSLIPAMNFRMARPTALVDLNKVKELSYIKPTADGGLAIGTMTRDSVVEEDLMVSERYPILVKTIQHIAHKQIRNRGTFGGAIAHADPAAQLPAASLLLDANLKILSKAGERWVKAVDFFIGPFMTVLEPEELLAEVVLPPMAPRTGGSYQQVSRQKGGYAQAAVISTVTLDASDKVKEARVALFSVGESALLANKPDQVLAGQVPTAEAIEEVAAYVAKNECDPGTDIHGTEEYRRNLVHVLVRRALTEAIQQAKR
ncbi:MAG: xanthine dehydrogenase family protein subunit M [Anaerolineaceae bacterium]|jgi:CO/xanthine dehydrogenase FAD-binding subunit|nr:xanthine dehydrogenase family protein subunit M [Anaerolineaceae bacterium]